MPNWLKKAVFYEIYPQSFMDSNGDGIGDINGIREKLGYIRSLGCNALWINPCYDSPFKDAGYDVRDYKKVAPRYGTNENLISLFEEAHDMGIHVLLDLVPGHTSEEHPWFLESKKAERNEYSDRYIWTDSWIAGAPGYPYIGGEAERDGTYLLNFFKCQPALNYGWAHPQYPWQFAADSEPAKKTLEAIMDVMRFWLDRGCDGFRVDMADSLVKGDDENKSYTSACWRKVRNMLDREYPEAAMVSEWSHPVRAINQAGFHMDFYLDHHGNGYNTLLRDRDENGDDHSYFRCGAGGDICRFLDDYIPKYEATKDNGYISFMTCNHDTPRVTRTLSAREIKLAYAVLLTLPGVPFIYYGDEIGMRYMDGMPTKEGGYTRTGTRTPMQWTDGTNRGFSSADPGMLYLPMDPDPDAPSVSAQENDPESLLNTVRKILKIRADEPDLGADAPFEVLFAEKGKDPFAFRRGELIIAVNPGADDISCGLKFAGEAQPVFSIGSFTLNPSGITMGPQSYIMLKQR